MRKMRVLECRGKYDKGLFIYVCVSEGISKRREHCGDCLTESVLETDGPGGEREEVGPRQATMGVKSRVIGKFAVILDRKNDVNRF